MKIKTLYLKVDDLASATQFWRQFLEVDPIKKGGDCQEFPLENICLTLLRNPGDSISSSNVIPVFECSEEEIMDYIELAKELGARIIDNCLDDIALQTVVMEDPSGNEFELSKLPS